MKHTKEPWKHDATLCIPDDGVIQIYTREENIGEISCFEMPKLAKQNADRIVECVNACEGIENPTEAIGKVIAALEAAILLCKRTGVKDASFRDAWTSLGLTESDLSEDLRLAALGVK